MSLTPNKYELRPVGHLGNRFRIVREDEEGKRAAVGRVALPLGKTEEARLELLEALNAEYIQWRLCGMSSEKALRFLDEFKAGWKI